MLQQSLDNYQKILKNKTINPSNDLNANNHSNIIQKHKRMK
jgi:hypothetical protein